MARQDKAALDISIQRAEDDTKARNAELYDAAATAKARVAVLEDHVRELTLAAFELNPDNKRPAEGVGIRVLTKWIIDYDIKRAFAWAVKLKSHLQLNVKTFEEMCRAPETKPAFVTVTEIKQPTATIDTMLPI